MLKLPGFSRGKNSKKRSRQSLPLLSERSDFKLVESYKSIRTNLMFAAPEQGCKTIIVTSSLPDEGKSTTCVNLGISFAENSERVLLMDGDLRNPSLNKMLRLRSTPGLSEVLANMAEIDEVIQPSQISTNLDVLPSGTIPPNPTELLGSSKMAQVLAALGERYDYILIDTPPVNLLADTIVLTPRTNGVVLVVRENVTKHPELKEAMESLDFASARVLGIVVNASSSEGKGRYAYNYGYGYGAHRSKSRDPIQ